MEMDVKKGERVDIEFPKEFVKLTRHFEIYCDTGCCGLDAFDFCNQDAKKLAVKELGNREISTVCGEAIEFAKQFDKDPREFWSNQNEFAHTWENGAALHLWVNNIAAEILMD